MGKKRAIRPVNSGSMFLKNPLRCALSDRTAKRVQALQARTQMGNGMAYGCHTKVALARALYEAGFFVSLQDAINAFNALERQAMLDVVDDIWPEATSIVNKTYGLDAPCIFLFDDDSGDHRIACMLSQQGVRMGCVLGSFLYCLTVWAAIYKVLEKEFPELHARAATDDLTSYGTADTPEGWQELYKTLERYIVRFAQLGKPIGILLHPGKGDLLLPPNAPDPDNPGLLRLTTVTRGAVRDTGGYIGPDDAVRAESTRKAESVKPLHNAIRELGKQHALPAYRLNAQCAISKLSYFMAVTPPRLVAPAIEI